MPLINPFQNLYVTERLSGEEFVRVVSPLIVEHCVELFGAGNVILQGTQGSGKTTLLTLLEQNIREAYLKNEVDFPVPMEYRNFISVGINLTKSGILDIGKRPVLRGDECTEEDNFPLLFGDFLNYHVCKELFTLRP